jgi:hypothetical protein
MQVSVLAAYAVEQVAYSHGQKSAEDLIIAMAQSFVGSNNINLLKANGGRFNTKHEVRSQAKGQLGFGPFGTRYEVWSPIGNSDRSFMV